MPPNDPFDPSPAAILGGVSSPALDRRPPFEAVLSVLSREDPEGLLAVGAPIDEYCNEAADLAGSLRDGRPVTGEGLVEVWERWFGPGSGYVSRTSKPQVDKVAAELNALH
jgi:hypothetical protein